MTKEKSNKQIEKTVIKRDLREVKYDRSKIVKAVDSAMRCGTGYVDEKVSQEVSEMVEKEIKNIDKVSIQKIEDLVFDSLCEIGEKNIAKEYEGYRKIREFQRNRSKVDNEIMNLIGGKNESTQKENSNKDPILLSTQRDLIAGEISKDLTDRLLLSPNVYQAHKNGVIHFHDRDYSIQRGMFNCHLINLDDMLQNGTIINKKMIEKPKSFQTACTVATQIVQQVSGGQYGGSTMSLSHLAPFVRDSYNKYEKSVRKMGEELGLNYSEATIRKIAGKRLSEEITAGIQTIQYQINTFNTVQGQSPFLSIFMYVNEKEGYEKETSLLIEEMLKQRYKGMKNEQGVYISPAFPKLLYVLGESNVSDNSKFRHLTDLAVKCVSKRMMPDFISEKIMLQHYGGVFAPMGCRAFLSPYTSPETDDLKWYGRFNQGVVSLNLVDVGLSANKNMDRFWDILDERLDLCFEALMVRHNELKGTLSDVSPIHWQHGSIARLEAGETIDKLLYDGYSTLSLGYVGLYETIVSLIGESNTSEKGEKLSLEIVSKLREKVDKWKKETNIGFALYSTPAESTVYTFAGKLKDKFGIVEGVTDKDYITNSFHVNVEEEIDAFDKLTYEAQFHSISSGGCISYVEVPNLQNNLEAIKELVNFMCDNIQYAEINTKSDYCHICGFSGEILIDDECEWYCPKCDNKDQDKMNVCRRT